MYVDAITVAALSDELNEKLVGGRVQSVVEVDDQSLGMEIYANRQRHYLLMSIDPRTSRCHLVPDKLRRGTSHASPLGLLMRKYVEGARLNAVRQPAWERILHLDFSGDNGDTRLIVEMMDRRSNIVLTVEGDILDCFKRVGAYQNRYRVLLPGKPYVPPPLQPKVRPEDVTLSMLSTLLRQGQNMSVWRILVDNINGISPLFAREIVYFASGDTEAPAFDVSAAMIHAAFVQRLAEVRSRRWSPCVVPTEGGKGYIAFAAYCLTHLEGWRPVSSISEAMWTYFGAPVGPQAYDSGKQHVQAQIDRMLDRMQRKLASLKRQTADNEELERLRQQGELLLAYGSTLRPGQTVLHAQYDPEGPMLEIGIDPRLSYSENAQKYFERYEKGKRAAADVPRRIADVRREVEYLKQLATDLALAESWPEIDAVREALQVAGYWQGSPHKTPRSGKPGIRRFTTEDGFLILVGRNAEQNHLLLTERSVGEDLWVHARDVAGSHVIIKNDGRPIPDSVIQRAAELAAYYSAGQGNALVDVDVTERRHVRPIKGGRPGMVTYKNERTVRVRPRK